MCHELSLYHYLRVSCHSQLQDRSFASDHNEKACFHTSCQQSVHGLRESLLHTQRFHSSIPSIHPTFPFHLMDIYLHHHLIHNSCLASSNTGEREREHTNQPTNLLLSFRPFVLPLAVFTLYTQKARKLLAPLCCTVYELSAKS